MLDLWELEVLLINEIALPPTVISVFILLDFYLPSFYKLAFILIIWLFDGLKSLLLLAFISLILDLVEPIEFTDKAPFLDVFSWSSIFWMIGLLTTIFGWLLRLLIDSLDIWTNSEEPRLSMLSNSFYLDFLPFGLIRAVDGEVEFIAC